MRYALTFLNVRTEIFVSPFWFWNNDLLTRSINISIGVSDAGLGSAFGVTINDDLDVVAERAATFRRVADSLSRLSFASLWGVQLRQFISSTFRLDITSSFTI